MKSTHPAAYEATSSELDAHLRAQATLTPPYLEELTRATEAHSDYLQMITPPAQGQCLAFLIRLIGAKTILEVGTFTGVGTLWMAHAAGRDATIHTLDISDKYTHIGESHWHKAKLDERIHLHIAPALDTLDKLLSTHGTDSFDFTYIDADKTNYPTYVEKALELTRPGGLIALDNMLQGGRIADPSYHDANTDTLRPLAQQLAQDPRVDSCLLPIHDGLHLLKKN